MKFGGFYVSSTGPNTEFERGFNAFRDALFEDVEENGEMCLKYVETDSGRPRLEIYKPSQ